MFITVNKQDDNRLPLTHRCIIFIENLIKNTVVTIDASSNPMMKRMTS